MLTEMAGELRHALEQVSEPSAKEEKTELKKKHKQLKELEEHRDKLQEYDCHLEKMCIRDSYRAGSCFIFSAAQQTDSGLWDVSSSVKSDMICLLYTSRCV